MAGKSTLSCPLCNSHDLDDYAVVGYGSQLPPDGVPRYAVLRCRRHGVEFADALPGPRPNACADMTACYGDPNQSSPRYVEFMERVEAMVGPPAGRTLHDVGCGVGNLLFEARRRGWQVQGNDVDSSVKDGIDKNGIPCQIGSLADLDISCSSCEVVTSFCVLPHHLAEPTPDMLAVARILKPGGWFVLQFPDNGLFRRASKLLYRLVGDTHISRRVIANLYGPGGHHFAYTRKNLAEYLSERGFKEMVFQSYSGSPRITLRRFRAEPLWYRTLAAIAVYGLKMLGGVLGTPNHSVVFARKTGVR